MVTQSNKLYKEKSKSQTHKIFQLLPGLTNMLERNIITANPQLINNEEKKLYDVLLESLNECQSFFFNVAFISFSGFQLFINSFDALRDKGVTGKILTSTYLNFTDPAALARLLDYENIELKLHDDKSRGLHSKSYIFEYENEYKIIIGSSNLTPSALKNNIEWNVIMMKKDNDPFVNDVKSEYLKLWSAIEPASTMIIDRYRPLFEERKRRNELALEESKEIVANSMQREALANLKALRDHGKTKALVIAATATGKTYLSAMDVKQTNARRVLFIAHRESILNSAMESFERIFGEKYSYSKLIGLNGDRHNDFIFSTNLTLNNRLHDFKPDDFDYLIIDEAHHVSAATYQNIVKYFEPKFTLGMTATPERGDQNDIFKTFDHNIALEVRLDRAIDEQLIVPFHYFGITDIQEVDLSHINPDNLSEISSRLMIHSRTRYILSKMKDFGFDGKYLKGLGFCVNLEHAAYMTKEFNDAGIPSTMLSGKDNPFYRDQIFKRLEDDEDELEMIFSVDVLNEGIDIPAINLVLMLRPTNSPIVFLQQLGRGLRKYKQKEFLTVLDFIANYQRSFLLALALSGNQSRDKDHLKVQVKRNFSMGPKRIFIQMDEIVKEQIIYQLQETNFKHLKYLKEDYKQFKQSWLLLKEEETSATLPLYLRDYYGVDRAPDPLIFANYKNNYIQFLSRVEDSPLIKKLISDQVFMKCLNTLTKELPLIRPIDFLIVRYVFEAGELSKDEIYSQLKLDLDEVPTSWFQHSLTYLDEQYDDSSTSKTKVKLVNVTKHYVEQSETFSQQLADSDKREIIMDVIEYGLLRYFSEYTSKFYGEPIPERSGTVLNERMSLLPVMLQINYPHLEVQV